MSATAVFLLRRADDVLRGRMVNTEKATSSHSLAHLAAIILTCSVAYGAVMGSFGGVGGDRVWQVLYSALKVPLLLVVTFLLSLPSFFVLNTFLRLRSDFPRALRAHVTAQAGLAILLVALAPLTLVWYASSADYQAAILFNALMFAVASGGAQFLLRRGYRPLVARRPTHRSLLRLWLFLYAFIGIQMGWLLRPFVGAPDKPVQFFREGAWDNAYVIVLRMMWNVVAS